MKKLTFLAGAATGVVAANVAMKTLVASGGSVVSLVFVVTDPIVKTSQLLFKPWWADINWDAELAKEPSKSSV